MKKLQLILILALVTIISSCSKSDPAPAPIPGVNPLAAYLTATSFNEKTINHIDGGDYEFGLSFIPKVNGKITALVVKIPDANAALRMTIWNKTAGTILKTETINYATADVEVTEAIDAVNLTAGTEYILTFNSNDWYERKANTGDSVIYPILVGNISITGFGYAFGSAQVPPNFYKIDYYAGDLSFKFQKS